MTIDEAIKHCEDKSRDESICKECRADHKQLAKWLKELRKLRERCKDLEAEVWQNGCERDRMTSWVNNNMIVAVKVSEDEFNRIRGLGR